MMARIEVGSEMGREELLRKFCGHAVQRNDVEFERGNFRVRGDTVEICPSYTEDAVALSSLREGGADHALRAADRSQD